MRREGGLILAMPADEALRRRVDALARGEAAGRPRLGVALAPPRHARRMRSAAGLPERDGLLVRGVVDGQPGRARRAPARRPARAAPAAGRCARSTTCSTPWTAAGDELTLACCAGDDERESRSTLGADPYFSS